MRFTVASFEAGGQEAGDTVPYGFEKRYGSNSSKKMGLKPRPLLVSVPLRLAPTRGLTASRTALPILIFRSFSDIRNTQNTNLPINVSSIIYQNSP